MEAFLLCSTPSKNLLAYRFILVSLRMLSACHPIQHSLREHSSYQSALLSPRNPASLSLPSAQPWSAGYCVSWRCWLWFAWGWRPTCSTPWACMPKSWWLNYITTPRRSTIWAKIFPYLIPRPAAMQRENVTQLGATATFISALSRPTVTCGGIFRPRIKLLEVCVSCLRLPCDCNLHYILDLLPTYIFFKDHSINCIVIYVLTIIKNLHNCLDITMYPFQAAHWSRRTWLSNMESFCQTS